MRRIIYKYILSNELPMEGRLFNVIAGFGTVGAFIATVVNIFNSTSLQGVLSIFVLAILLMLLLYYANRTGHYQNASMIICISVCCVLFPVISVTSGGFISGMPCWYILGIFIIFTMLRGKRLVISLFCAFAVQAACVFVEYRFPEYVSTYIPSSLAQYYDILYSYVVVSIVCGLTIKLQVTVYAKEKLKAEEASKAKADFLANMSHEIRTPINAILGMNEMIQRESTEEHIQEYASDIAGASRNLLSIINDVLDFSKIESGAVEILPVRYQLSSLINDLYNLIKPRAEQKGILLNVEVNPNIPSVYWGDEFRISQIILNLLTNSVKYTKTGSVTLKVNYETMFYSQLATDNLHANATSAVRLIISVIDTGQGIKENELEKIFNAFQRVDQKRNRSIEGTGLGLSISKHLVDLMDGKISVDSQYGEGSCFTVELPQQVLDEEPAGKFIFKTNDNRMTKVEKTADFIAPEARILAVDDNEMNLHVLNGLLKRTQVQVDSCTSGEKCLSMLKSKEYDLILLDHMMPEMDGVETIKIIHREQLAQSVPIIALTANAISGAREMYISVGFQDYLSKPISGEKLERMLKKWLPKSLLKDPSKMKENQPSDQTRDNNGTTSSKADEAAAFEAIENFKMKVLEQLEAQVDVKQAMIYSVDGVDGVVDNVDLYCAHVDKTIESLQQFYEKQDMYNYAIEIHALKGNCALIGALPLRDRALELENAAKSEHWDVIEKNHHGFLNDYHSLSKELSYILDMYKKHTNVDNIDGEVDNQEQFLTKEELISLYKKMFQGANDFDMIALKESGNVLASQVIKDNNLYHLAISQEDSEQWSQWSDCYTKLLEAIEEYDYDIVEQMLEKLIKWV